MLDSFGMPALPKPLSPQLAFTLTLTAGSPGGGVQPQAYGDDPTGPAGSTSDPTSSDKSSSSGSGCLGIVLAIVTLVVAGLIICIGLLTTEGKCTPARVWEVLTGGGGDDPPPETSTQPLVTAAGSGAGAELVQEFAKAQGAIWQALSQARTFLATIGLVYPTSTQLATPLFRQFTTTPNVGPGLWPRREPADEFDSYVYAPTTPVEQPAGNSPMPPELDPGYIPERLPAWIGELVSHLFDEPANMDLDADRGLLHRCWDLQPGGHITDQPLPVRLLAYSET